MCLPAKLKFTILIDHQAHTFVNIFYKTSRKTIIYGEYLSVYTTMCMVTRWLNSLFIINCLRLWNVSLPTSFVVSMQFQHSDARTPTRLPLAAKIALSCVVDN